MKKLEIVGCFRFRDGDAAEEGGEECGAMVMDERGRRCGIKVEIAENEDIFLC